MGNGFFYDRNTGLILRDFTRKDQKEEHKSIVESPYQARFAQPYPRLNNESIRHPPRLSLDSRLAP